MAFLAILFVPPLYLLFKGKVGACVLNSVLYLLAWLTVWFFGIGVLFWGLAVGHAGWHYRKEAIREQARVFADEIAARQSEEAK